MRSNYPRSKQLRAKNWFERSIGMLPTSMLIGACMLAVFIHLGHMIDEEPSFSPSVAFLLFFVLPAVAAREIWLTRLSTVSRKIAFYALSCLLSGGIHTAYVSRRSEPPRPVSAGEFFNVFFFSLCFSAIVLAFFFGAVYSLARLKKQYFPSDADYGLEPEDVALPEPMLPMVQSSAQTSSAVSAGQEER
jgi:uncharacterized membrane protein YjgN (DUF898 family)